MIVLCWFWLALVGGENPGKLQRVKINDQISVAMPASLKPMTPEDLAYRFPSVRAPLGAFTNDDRVVDFTINISATQWPDLDARLAAQFFKASLLEMFDRTDILAEGVRELEGRTFIYFELETRMNGTRGTVAEQSPIMKYTHIQYLVGPQRTLVFTFTCPREMKKEWRETAGEMMTSVRLKM